MQKSPNTKVTVKIVEVHENLDTGEILEVVAYEDSLDTSSWPSETPWGKPAPQILHELTIHTKKGMITVYNLEKTKLKSESLTTE